MKIPSRTYDKEFKINAVKLYKEGNKGLEVVAKDYSDHYCQDSFC